MSTVRVRLADLESGDITRQVLLANANGPAVNPLVVYWRLGLLRFRAIEDHNWSFEDLCGDTYNPQANPDIPLAQLKKEKEAFRSRVRNWGVWGVAVEVRANSLAAWRQPDEQEPSAIWGFVGGDFVGSGYEPHMMQLAYDWLAHNCNDTLWRLFAHAQGACSMVMQTSERVDDPGLRSDIQASLKHLRATLASVSLGN